MILFLYNLALFAGLAASAPWWVWRMVTTQKYREGLPERLGRVPPWLASKAAERPVLWLHAVSVGEVLAASRLVRELDEAFPGYQVLLSTTTRTGQELARQRFGPNRVFYCPLDLPWAVRVYLNVLKPRMLLLAETEFWPNLLATCFRRNIPVVVVNARISDRSWPRYRKLRRLWQPFLSRLQAVLAQTPADADRLKAIGCDPGRVVVSGNLKFDVRTEAEAEATRILKDRADGLRIVVAGSTLEGEEKSLLGAWPRLCAEHPDLLLLLAPRHPERFAGVAALLDSSGLSWVRRSEWKGRAVAEIDRLHAGQVVLLDTIGELASTYSLAAIAFVGGSLVAAGGHNPLEPAQFAVPIVMGEHYANFRAITEDLRSHEALRIADPGNLAQTLGDLLTDQPAARAMGQRARQVFEAQAGATGRTVKAIGEVLGQKASPK